MNSMNHVSGHLRRLQFILASILCLSGAAAGLAQGDGPDKALAWQTLRVEREGFEVEMPGKSKRQPQEAGSIYAVEVNPKLAYLTGAARLEKGATDKQRLDAAQENFAKEHKLLEATDLPAESGLRGRTMVMQDKEGDFIVNRMILSDTHVYQLIIVSNQDRRKSPDTERFFKSFKIIPVVAGPVRPVRPPRDPKTRPATGEPATLPADADAITQALAGLKSSDLRQRKDALRKLQSIAVDAKRRDEVAKAVAPVLADTDHFTRGDALKTLALWWTAGVVDDMVKATTDTQFSVRWAAYDALGKVADVRAYEACAAGLATDQGKARQALKTQGSPAEHAVQRMLRNGDRKVVSAACEVLGDIGTAKSLPALRTLSNDKDFFTRSAATRAAKKIEARGGR